MGNRKIEEEEEDEEEDDDEEEEGDAKELDGDVEEKFDWNRKVGIRELDLERALS